MQVNPFARGLGGDQDLDGAVFELLLGVQARTRLITPARLHTAVNTTNAETPVLQALHEVVECILELCKEQQTLLGVVKEALLPQEAPQASELCLCPSCLNGLGLGSEALQAVDLFAPLRFITPQGDSLQDSLQTLAFVLLHLLDLLRVGQIGWRQSRQLAGALHLLGEPSGPVVQGMPQGLGT